MGSVALGQNMNADIEKGIFDRFRSLPIARSVPMVGAVFADFARYLILCVVYLGFGYLIGFRIETNAAGLIGAVALAIGFALCFCWVSLWVGLKARTSGAVQGIMFLIILPLSFGSSAFVPPSTMPGWLQGWNHFNPITRLIDSMRGLMLGGPVMTNLLGDPRLDGRPAAGLRPPRDARLQAPRLRPPPAPSPDDHARTVAIATVRA